MKYILSEEEYQELKPAGELNVELRKTIKSLGYMILKQHNYNCIHSGQPHEEYCDGCPLSSLKLKPQWFASSIEKNFCPGEQNYGQ